METLVCSICAKDKYLKQIIEKDGLIGQCLLCFRERKVFTVVELAKLIAPIVKKYYERRPSSFDHFEHRWWQPKSYDLGFIVSEILGGQFFEFQNELIHAVIDTGKNSTNKKTPFFDDVALYIERERTSRLEIEWCHILLELKHNRRFFNSSAKDFFTKIFQDLETMHYWNDEIRKYESVVTSLRVGSEIYRARICDSSDVLKTICSNPEVHMGPPPPSKARAGRMNAEGVPVFYGAADPETCLAEMRPPLSSDIAVVTFETAQKLRMLNFKRLNKCYGELSYFQSDYEKESERFEFLRLLEKLISKPIIPGNETEYLITQTMTEFLAHFYENLLDGIIFRSSQYQGGINVVLFGKCVINETGLTTYFPLTYVDKSLRLFSALAVKYSYQEKHLSIMGDSVLPYSYPWEEHPEELGIF